MAPGIYTFKDLSESVFNILQTEYEQYNNSVDIEFDAITRRTKLILRPGTIAIRFDDISFFSPIFGFQPHWDYKQYNKNISQKLLN